MKTTFIAALLLSFATLNSAFAAQLVNNTDGKEKIGVVSMGGAYTLDDLSDALSRKADKQGASAYKIISAAGNNKLYGVAEIYR
ncbi:DUF1471 domain-containing protein [Enterobacteriaceae bacterium 4M9]|nr:DUF1471 domain-containing protein [Enterobacteriaceae bacterium 4M9]